MCGAYYLQQSQSLRDHFGIESKDDLKDFVLSGGDLDPMRLFDSTDRGDEKRIVFRPTDQVPFLAIDKEGGWIGNHATWWLAMEQHGDGWRPNQKFATFNSRIDKVVSGDRSIHNMKPRSFRVILPATGFVEWHDKRPHLFTRSDGQALMLGGMAKAYELADGYHFAASIVTLPGHPKTRHVHEKSVPLMLSDAMVDAWLDRHVPHSDFSYLMEPQIPLDLLIQPVSDLSHFELVGQPESVPAD